jgi:hypothetical protein
VAWLVDGVVKVRQAVTPHGIGRLIEAGARKQFGRLTEPGAGHQEIDVISLSEANIAIEIGSEQRPLQRKRGEPLTGKKPDRAASLSFYGEGSGAGR